MADGWVYILTNRPNGTLYVGVTDNLARRVWEHREGVVEGFTKRYGLKRLVYAEHHGDIRLARQREHNIKHYPRVWKVRLIGQQPELGGSLRPACVNSWMAGPEPGHPRKEELAALRSARRWAVARLPPSPGHVLGSPMGLIATEASGRGDLLVRVRIRVPEKLTKQSGERDGRAAVTTRGSMSMPVRVGSNALWIASVRGAAAHRFNDPLPCFGLGPAPLVISCNRS